MMHEPRVLLDPLTIGLTTAAIGATAAGTAAVVKSKNKKAAKAAPRPDSDAPQAAPRIDEDAAARQRIRQASSRSASTLLAPPLGEREDPRTSKKLLLGS